MAWPKGAPRAPTTGRKKGTKNRKTVAVSAMRESLLTGHATPLLIHEWTRAILEDPAVHIRLYRELVTSEPLSVALLNFLASYAYGRPKEQVAITGAEGGPLQIIIQRRILTEECEALEVQYARD